MTTPRIGIRREDKNPWERRVPLTPRHVAGLTERGIEVHIEDSEKRVFPLAEYEKVGAQTQSLDACQLIFGVKEMPLDFFEPQKTYVFFSHTIKGQAYNMALLKRMIEQGISLIDYECIADADGNRLVFFSRHAGLAGMVETLVAFGQRLAWEGRPNPLTQLKHAREYSDLNVIQEAVSAIGKEWNASTWAPEPGPTVAAFLGSGNVSRGAIEIFQRLSPEVITPQELRDNYEQLDPSGRTFYQVTYSRRDLARPKDPTKSFNREEYDRSPELYESALVDDLPKISMLVSGITWMPEYPVFVPKAALASLYLSDSPPALKVVGDITCDIEGSIGCTVRPSDLENPTYVWDPETGQATPGIEGKGPVVMAVDNLPTSLPIDASRSFGDALEPFVEGIAKADFSQPFDKLVLPDPIRRALVLHRGQFTPDFEYMKEFLDS